MHGNRDWKDMANNNNILNQSCPSLCQETLGPP
jgi:hypothetical protein